MATDNKPTVSEVEKLANLICMEYQNSKFFAWYCGAIYEFGIITIEDLMKRVSDARSPGMLFTKIINEWRKEKRNKQNRDRLYGNTNE